MTRIDIDDLMLKLGNLDSNEGDIAGYFILDEDNEAPFTPRFKLNPETVQIPAGADGVVRSALALNLANWYARMRRRKLFFNRISSGYSGPIIVAEGDSYLQYPLLLKDIVDHLLENYAIYCLSGAGDLLEDMRKSNEIIPALRDTGAQILLLSGGGNDLLENGQLANHLESFRSELNAGDYLKPSFDRLIADAIGNYEAILRTVHGTFPQVSVIVHGYDYPRPNNGRWLGKPMQTRGIHDVGLQSRIVVEMMDRFNRALRRMVDTLPHVIYLDVRNTVGAKRWHDELHPTDEGYGAVAALIDREIGKLINRPRTGPTVAMSGPFGRVSDLVRAIPEAVQLAPSPAGTDGPAFITGTGNQAISLHVGLNLVDPAGYAGWDGQLNGCENDAVAMREIGRRAGFDTQLLLTRDATSEAVIESIADAARRLRPGGLFLFTLAGHGARVPDWNHDEMDNGSGVGYDNTICLYDSMLVDDELRGLWSLFDEGVRVLMVGDTCHAGTQIRFNPFGESVPGISADALFRPRTIPASVEGRVLRESERQYKDSDLGTRVARYLGLSQNLLLEPVDNIVIKASIMGLAATQDHQYALDGPEHGVFTAALLKIWDNGRFLGDYRELRSAVEREIASPLQIPKLDTKLVKDSAFMMQRAFTPWPRVDGGEGVRLATVAVGTDATVSALHEEFEPDDASPDAGSQRRANASDWGEFSAFRDFFDGLGLRYFKAEEFLILGGSHGNPNSSCYNRNSLPPRDLWNNIAATARVLDELRKRLGRAIILTNAYRAPVYNKCIDGAPNSLHTRFNAIDFRVEGTESETVATALRWMRDREKLFKGGIGIYRTFVHIDTRGTNKMWVGKGIPFPGPLTDTSPFGAPEQLIQLDLASFIRQIPLAPPRQFDVREVTTGKGKTGKPGAPASVLAISVPREGALGEISSDILMGQQTLGAALAGAGIVSFASSLSPGQKEDVLLSTLFAQRAADHAADPVSQREEWFRTYLEVLGRLGWVRLDDTVEVRRTVEAGANLHTTVLPILASIATGNQIAAVKRALDALSALGDEDSIVRLFDLRISRSNGGAMQIGMAEGFGEDPVLVLAALSYAHRDTRGNVLFVSWGSNELSFWLAAQRLLLVTSAYSGVRGIVRERLAPTLVELVRDIPLA